MCGWWRGRGAAADCQIAFVDSVGGDTVGVLGEWNGETSLHLEMG